MSSPSAIEKKVDSYVGSRLKNRRTALGISMGETADSVAVTTQQMHKYERAINRLSCSKMYGLSKFLNVPVSYFFENIEEFLTNENLSFNESQILVRDDDFVSEREVIKLVQMYRKINSPFLRKKINELVDAISNDELTAQNMEV